MAKSPRSRAANLGRRARKSKPTTPPPVPTPEGARPAPTPEELAAILQQQVIAARNAFFRLAQVRAADRVRFGELNWDQGAEYINAEIAALDQQLAAAVPKG